MRFDIGDRNDLLVEETSPYELDYPKDVDNAPDKVGVYIFIDDKADVIFIGQASSGSLKADINAKRKTTADKDSKKYRWFSTKSDETAKILEANWIKKYNPRYNVVSI